MLHMTTEQFRFFKYVFFFLSKLPGEVDLRIKCKGEVGLAVT